MLTPKACKPWCACAPAYTGKLCRPIRASTRRICERAGRHLDEHALGIAPEHRQDARASPWVCWLWPPPAATGTGCLVPCDRQETRSALPRGHGVHAGPRCTKHKSDHAVREAGPSSPPHPPCSPLTEEDTRAGGTPSPATPIAAAGLPASPRRRPPASDTPTAEPFAGRPPAGDASPATPATSAHSGRGVLFPNKKA